VAGISRHRADVCNRQKLREAHEPAIRQLRNDLSAQLSEILRLEFHAGGDTGPGIVLPGRPSGPAEARGAEAGELTPVMARLGPVDLETLDALITAGIAASRAEAVRWALARIRERPAYAQFRERAREIESSRPSSDRAPRGHRAGPRQRSGRAPRGQHPS
jgi:Arc/MetJ-type ribon-helix-helix transcriptional regulator